MTKISTTACPLLALLLVNAFMATPLLAADTDEEERWYQIELIIFENKNMLDATEVWAETPGQADLDKAEDLLHSLTTIENNDPPEKLQAFKLLPAKLLTLANSIERLNSSNNYKPLLHIGWRQPVLERQDAKPLVIDTRKLHYREELHSDTMISSPDNAMSPPSLYEDEADEIVTEINQNFVKGTLKLTRGHYLHLDLDLLYQRQAATPQLFSFFGFGPASSVPELFRLTQRRRLKRGEVHYFDHPKFGVLAMVTAVEQDDSGQARTIPLQQRR